MFLQDFPLQENPLLTASHNFALQLEVRSYKL